MKNKIKTFLAIIVGLSAASALADQVYTTGTWGPYEYNPGGEFTLGVLSPGAAGNQAGVNPSILPDLNYYEPGVTANVTGNPGNPNFQTFCVEGSEYIYQNRTYDVTLQQSSLYGGLLGPKALTVGAALLYYDFAKGLFTGAGGVPSYNYLNTAGGRTGDAGKLQDAIWWLMGGQESQTYNSVNTYEHWINGLLGVHAFDANSSLAHPIDVSVLSLWEHGGAYTTAGADQDQLILTGNQGYSPVPDGGTTVALLGLAMSGLGFFSRKLRK